MRDDLKLYLDTIASILQELANSFKQGFDELVSEFFID